jgi:hypothetical protein
MAMKSEVDEAIKIHVAWRERFKDILYGRAPFDLDVISASDQCTLGKWLVNDGYRMMPAALHRDICDEHQEFHRIAAEILRKIKAKRYAEAKKDIQLDGALNRSSQRLKVLLSKLSFTEPAKEEMPIAENLPPGTMQETLEPLYSSTEETPDAAEPTG